MQFHLRLRLGRNLDRIASARQGGCYVLQVVPIRAPALSQWGNRHSFPRTRGSGQADRVGISENLSLFGLWLHGFCNS